MHFSSNCRSKIWSSINWWWSVLTLNRLKKYSACKQKYDEEKKKRRVHLWASLNWVRVNNAVNWNAGSVYLLSQPNSITYSLTKRHRKHTQLSWNFDLKVHKPMPIEFQSPMIHWNYDQRWKFCVQKKIFSSSSTITAASIQRDEKKYMVQNDIKCKIWGKRRKRNMHIRFG